MVFKKLKRLQELVDTYEWQKDYGLTVWIEYSNCQEVFDDILKVHSETYVDCLAQNTGICISHFEDVLSYYTTENIEDLFPKDED